MTPRSAWGRSPSSRGVFLHSYILLYIGRPDRPTRLDLLASKGVKGWSHDPLVGLWSVKTDQTTNPFRLKGLRDACLNTLVAKTWAKTKRKSPHQTPLIHHIWVACPKTEQMTLSLQNHLECPPKETLDLHPRVVYTQP